MFEAFEEWFAIRNRHDDEDIWPGRLKFSEENGILLEAIRIVDQGKYYDAPDCTKGTITGYLDYQRPTTVVDPWVQSQGSGSIGVDTPVARSKSRIRASAVLKNIHLEDLNEKCFTTLHMDMPAFNSWYAPQLVKAGYEHTKENSHFEVSVAIDRPEREEFTLEDGTSVLINASVRTSEEENTIKVIQKTLLTFEFPDSIDYSDVQKRIWRVNTLFSFFLGHRMAHNPYHLKTTHTRKWNGHDEHITAELFFSPAFKSKRNHVKWYDALFLRHDCALTPEELVNAASKQPDAIFYLMNMVLLMEKPEKLSGSDFSELIGCIEDFDIKVNGSGSSENVAIARKTLRKLVKEHGSLHDLQTLDTLTQTQPNRFSLTERLGRLQQIWSESGFRGDFQSSEVTRIRNNVAHGRGVNLSAEDYHRMIWLNYDLCAMSRFHIFRTLGVPAKQIGAAFRKLGFRYGKYAPETTSAQE